MKTVDDKGYISITVTANKIQVVSGILIHVMGQGGSYGKYD